MTGRGDEGNLVITFMSEETVTLYDQWYSFIFETEGVFPAPESSQLAFDAFASGEALIIPGLVMTALKLADMEDGYGIIPYLRRFIPPVSPLAIPHGI